MEDLKPGDMVKVGFTTGKVERVDGAWAFVTYQDRPGGAIPHRVPVTSVRKLEGQA